MTKELIEIISGAEAL
ncbi:MAG: hypothetical protein V3V03_00515 [Hyphomonadaceae bacterium]